MGKGRAKGRGECADVGTWTWSHGQIVALGVFETSNPGDTCDLYSRFVTLFTTVAACEFCPGVASFTCCVHQTA